ncbi:MAG TPA: YkgJ family cysteine cluster protein [Polyangiaceae bacterium]|nr:YkgJ family cysteine cluster protein [Polyangiaceae bacterium]
MSQWRSSGKKRRARATPPTAARGVKDQQGRLHLVVRQDAAGATQVSLRQPLFNETWQNDLVIAAASTAHASLSKGLTVEHTTQLTRQMMDATSKLADGLIARAANGKVACKPGCDHCCYQSVGVTPAEALTIVRHLEQTLSSDALRSVKRDLAEATERTKGLSSRERFSPDHPCPFLKQSQCSIYEVRPLSCRGMNSLDAAECRDQLHDPQVRAAFLASGRGGHAFMEPIRAFHAISAGLQLGLHELFGLDMRPLDLTAAMHQLLSADAPNEVGAVSDASASPSVRTWLAGEPAFEAARGGDSTDDVNVLELSGKRE